MTDCPSVITVAGSSESCSVQSEDLSIGQEDHVDHDTGLRKRIFLDIRWGSVWGDLDTGGRSTVGGLDEVRGSPSFSLDI